MNVRLILIALAALACALPVRADHDAIDEAFAKAAPQVLDQLKARKAKNVGILKFLVQRGDSKPDDAVGELNLGLADRFEAAIILACKKDEKLGIIDRASLAVVANKNRLANHRTEDGRQAFFADSYKLAWGGQKVKPTEFVTGLATISKDLKSVAIRLEMFGADGEVQRIGETITVPTTRRTLVEAGYSYVIAEKAAPNIFDGARGSKTNKGAIVQVKAEDDAAALDRVLVMNDPAKTDGVKFTAAEACKESPIRLTILYNGKPVSVEADRVREPAETDEVSFLIENTDAKNTYAVVLKVNGKNTIFSEDAEPAQCLKWVLEPNGKHEIRGFQEDNGSLIPFRILSTKESEENAVRYGDLGGTVRLVAFRGELATEDPSAVEKKEPEPQRTFLAAVSRGAKGLKKGDDMPGSLAALQADLLGREKELDGMRGIIDKGAKKEASAIQRVFFKPLPTVGVADITIRYYAAKK
jgi:hypothetical protein